MIDLRQSLVGCVALAALFLPLAAASAAEPDKPPKPSGHLVPESLSKWTITFADVSYLEDIQHIATIDSDGRVRFHSHAARGKDIDAKLSADELRSIYQATRDVMNWHHFEGYVGHSGDSDAAHRLRIALEDGQFVQVTLHDPELWRLGVGAQFDTIAATCNKHLRRAGATWTMDGTEREGKRGTSRPFSEVIPKSLKNFAVGVADRNWWFGAGMAGEGGASQVDFLPTEATYLSSKGVVVRFPFTAAEQDRAYALVRKVFNGYELKDSTEKRKPADTPSRIVLDFHSEDRSLQLSCDRETLARLGALEEYTWLATTAAKRLAERKVDTPFLLPWERAANR